MARKNDPRFKSINKVKKQASEYSRYRKWIKSKQSKRLGIKK